jgi:hypothetical protein
MKKKGCFLKIIIVLTIIIAVILYIAQNHLDDVVINPAKKVISSFMVSGAFKHLTYIKENPEKDSLKILLKNYMRDKISKSKSISDEDLDWLIDSIKVIATDSLITKDDLNKIKELINLKDYEKPKKN